MAVMRLCGKLLMVVVVTLLWSACGGTEQVRSVSGPDTDVAPEDASVSDTGTFTAGGDSQESTDSGLVSDVGSTSGNEDAGGVIDDSQEPQDTEQPQVDVVDTDSGTPEDVVKKPGTYCEPLGTRCVTPQIKQTCTFTGAFWADEFCPDGTGCQDGECLPQICIPLLSTGACAGTSTYFLCNESGTDSSIADCPLGLTCFAGECVDYVCEPGASVCVGNAAVQTCKDDGSGWIVSEVCQSGGKCVEATCHNACTVAASNKNAAGCQFVTTPLPTQAGGDTTLVLTVPGSSAAAQVTVRDALSGKQIHPVVMVEQGVPVLVSLAANDKLSKSHVGSSGVSLEATAPIFVRQFHPYDGKNEQAIQDGMLLSPLHGLGNEYLALGWFTQFPKVVSRHTYLTIVGAHDGVTEVTVVPRGSIQAGAEGAGVGETTAGLTVNFSLKFGEVLQLRAKGDHGTDLTGSWITSSRPVAVFSGHECATVPNGIKSCSHLAEQLPPVNTWGSEVVIQRFAKRSDGDHAVVRVVAGAEGVMVTTQPKLVGFEKVVLNKGGFITLPATGSYVIDANGPIMAGRFMIGGTHAKHGPECGGLGIGAPALTIATPTAQYLKKYSVVAPPLFKQTWLDIVAPVGAEILLNGTSISAEFVPIPETDWMTASVASSGGAQNLEASAPIAVTSYGYDCNGSYVLPGNHGLVPLDVQEVDAVKIIQPKPAGEDKKDKPKSELDTDSDGILDDDDNCIFEPNVHQTDFDQDGFGDACDPDVDGDGSLNWADCAPLDPALSPNNPEVCNGKDDNCDNEIDPADSVGCTAFWADMDADGAGAKGFGVCLCEPSGDFQVLFGGDCDDGNPLIHPWANEVCDNFDNDCNEAIDEGCDDDLDGWCDAELITPAFPVVCPNGGGDCNDYSKSISPADDKVEIDDNGLDDDCDGLTDDEVQLTLEPDCPSVTCDDKSAQDLLCSIGACYGVSYTLSANVESLTSGKSDQDVVGWLPMAQLGSPTNDLKPHDGKTYLVISTGAVQDGTNDADLGGAKQKLKDPYVVGTQNMFDAIEVTLNVKAPPGVTGFQVEYVFLSSGYPETVGQKNTDKFYVIKKTKEGSEVINVAGCADPDNFSDYTDGFGTWCYIDANSEFMESCDDPKTDITGTGYECNDKNDATGGSSTGWLRSSWPVSPNEEFQIVLHLHDTKNALSDSTVVIDNFRWLLESFAKGTVKSKVADGK